MPPSPPPDGVLLPPNYPPPLPQIRDDLRDLAFTHSSFARPSSAPPKFEDPEGAVLDNNAPEFLSDAVLNLAVGVVLRRRYPRLRSGPLTVRELLRNSFPARVVLGRRRAFQELRSMLVNGERLADWAKMYGFDRALKVPGGANSTAVRTSTANLAGCFEAYVSGIFEEHGEEVGIRCAIDWVERLIAPYAAHYYTLVRARYLRPSLSPSPSSPSSEFVSRGYLARLNEVAPKRGHRHEWRQSCAGEGHDPAWIMTLVIDGGEHEIARQASTKKIAMEMAALEGLRVLRIDVPQF